MLVVIVLTIGSVYAFGRSTVLDVMSSRQRAARVRAELLARAGVQIALRTLVDDLFMGDDLLTQSLESPYDAWRLLSQIPIEVPGGGTLRINVDDAGSRLNINALLDEEGDPHADSAAFLVAALERIIEELPGRKEEKPYDPAKLAEAILDWMDRDDQTRLGDLETNAYRDLPQGSLPLNRPLLDLEELAGVPGLDGLLLEAIKAYFTPYPMFPKLESSGVNPNTAAPHVLALIFHGATGERRLLDREEIFRILQARAEGKIFCPQGTGEECESFGALTGFVGESEFPPLQYQSSVFTVSSEGHYLEARACVMAVVDRTAADAPEILFYRMGC